MAVGEWLSVTAENEYLKGEIEAERAHIEDHRDEENEELESYFVEQGLRMETARSVVADLESHPDATSKLLSFHTRFHWGVEMDELGGSPAVAAVASFCAFAAGGIVPILPWTVPCSLVDRSKLLPPGGCLYAKLAITIFLSLLTAFAVGVTLTWSTPSNSVRGGLRYAAAAMMAALQNNLRAMLLLELDVAMSNGLVVRRFEERLSCVASPNLRPPLSVTKN